MLLVAAILSLAGCAGLTPQASCPACACPQCPAPTTAPPRAEPTYEAVPFSALPGWSSAALAPGLRAFVAGCPRIGAAHALRRACDAAIRVPADDEQSVRRFIEEQFSAWSVAAADGAAEGLVTGYYEPVLSGSRARDARFRIPVYGVPPDLVTVDLSAVSPETRGLRLRGRLEGNRIVPYWSRGEIDARAEFPAPILGWVDDAVELFFLQIQGSGQLDLGAGARLRLGYADQNGHPYRSLGRYLVDRREMTLEQASMQGIKAWAAANPGKLRDALAANPSYVFFRELPPGDGGPPGALGAPLSAGYSIAVDPRSVPLGAPVFLATTFPLSAQPLQRLVAAQDTGGAIRGAVRADFYWGSGAEAGAQAGRMRQQGRMWILWPRGETLRAPAGG